jgi:pyruvate dehydrogenase E2 component (dihydrolipoamide acetyltransferase)
MPTTITMPALSPTMTEGTLARWLIKEGDTVSAGDVIAEIETDKATMEVEAVDEGSVGRLLVAEGTEGVTVNQPIAVLLHEGEDASMIGDAGESGPGGAGARASTDDAAGQPATAPQPESRDAERPVPAAAAAPAAPEPAVPAQRNDGDRVFASPLARRMAEKAGVDLAGIAGTGPRGRIVKADIEKVLAGGVPERPASSVAAQAPTAGGQPAAVYVPPTPAPVPVTAGATKEPVSNMRKVIARRLVESKQTIPHFYLTIDCAIDRLLALRKELNARDGADYKLSVNDFVIRAAALALHKVPDANASWAGDGLVRYASVDVSVAVALDAGLITPIVARADTKGLAEISREMKDLAARARDGKLKPEEYQGGTFSISNLGMFGIREFSAIINPPQSAILAVGAGEQRPVVRDGALAVATMMSCTLSCDHRVVDGALGARLLNVFRGFIEDPVTMLL